MPELTDTGAGPSTVKKKPGSDPRPSRHAPRTPADAAAKNKSDRVLDEKKREDIVAVMMGMSVEELERVRREAEAKRQQVGSFVHAT